MVKHFFQISHFGVHLVVLAGENKCWFHNVIWILAWRWWKSLHGFMFQVQLEVFKWIRNGRDYLHLCIHW